jgi:hypothetical protein
METTYAITAKQKYVRTPLFRPNVPTIDMYVFGDANRFTKSMIAKARSKYSPALVWLLTLKTGNVKKLRIKTPTTKTTNLEMLKASRWGTQKVTETTAPRINGPQIPFPFFRACCFSALAMFLS